MTTIGRGSEAQPLLLPTNGLVATSGMQWTFQRAPAMPGVQRTTVANSTCEHRECKGTDALHSAGFPCSTDANRYLPYAGGLYRHGCPQSSNTDVGPATAGPVTHERG